MKTLQAEAKKLAHTLKISESRALKLAKDREKHKLDILQPNNPLYEKVYGKQIAYNKKVREAQEDKSKELWHESQMRKKRNH